MLQTLPVLGFMNPLSSNPRSAYTENIPQRSPILLLRLQSRESKILQRLKDAGLCNAEFEAAVNDPSYGNMSAEDKAVLFCYLVRTTIRPTYSTLHESDAITLVETETYILESLYDFGLEPEKFYQTFTQALDKSAQKQRKKRLKQQKIAAIEACFAQKTKQVINAAKQEFDELMGLAAVNQREMSILNSHIETLTSKLDDEVLAATKETDACSTLFNEVVHRAEKTQTQLKNQQQHYYKLLEKEI